jgi:hypothetical protein
VKRRAALAAGLAGLVLAIPASAGPPGSIVDNGYEGRVERNPTTYFGFDVIRNGDTRRVAEVTSLLRYNCVNGSGGDALARVNGRLRIEDDRFAGTLRGEPEPFRAAHRLGPPGSATVRYELRGKLDGRRRAKGTIDAELFFPELMARRGSLVRCYSGKLDWKARRGANAPVAPR